jgi:hypothetical protein
MAKNFWLILLIISARSFVSMAQTVPDRGCATTEATILLQKRDPALAKRMDIARKAAQTYSTGNLNLRKFQQGDTIPVVFHVVYNNFPQNISDAQLLSQLAVLNEDFNRLNSDAGNTPPPFKAVAGNPRIHFCLAALDPYGKPSTGITRTFTSKPSFQYSENEVKFGNKGGHNVWNPELYLNIWVCNLADNILGYAQFPGGPPETDGIVLRYSSVGRYPINPFFSPYNLGRTATHEIGHWLGLRHIWGEEEGSCTDSDQISDTPNQSDKSTGCPNFPKISCNNVPNGDMFMNYMDYTNDACMNLFTQQQSELMNATLHTTRKKILSSNACTNILNADFRAEPEAIFPGETTNFFYYSNGRRPTSFFWRFEGGSPEISTDSMPKNIRYDNPGGYTVTLTISDAKGTDTEVKRGYLKVTTHDLQLYPNPASSDLTVGAPAGQTLRRIEIFNNVGQLVKEYALNAGALNVKVSGLRNGLYIVRGQTGQNAYLSRRVAIVH